MPDVILTTLRLIFLALVFVFLWQVSRSMTEHLGISVRWDKHRRGKRLVILRSENQQDREVIVKDVIVIGSSPDADFNLSDPYAADFHFRMTQQSGRLQLTDLGSTNGTYVNGRRVTHPVTLNRGDEIQVGKTIMEIR